jgi:hypothetical protein
MLISKVLDVNEIAEMTIAGPSYLGSFSKFRCTTSAANSFSLSENDIVFCFHPLAVSKFDMFAPLLPSSALTLESIFNQSDQSATSIELLSPTSQSYLMRRHSSVENVSSPSAFSAASRSNISQSIDAYVTNVRKLSPSWKDTMTLLSSPFSNGFLSHNAAAFVALPSRTLHWFAAARSSQQIESDELKAATPFVFRSGLVPLLDFGTVNGTSGLGLRSNKPHAIAMGSCYCYNALDVFDAFQSCIGISSLIASFEQVKSPQELYSALVAIGSCLHHSVSSQTEMETCGGYLILSKTLSEHTAWIDERIANLLIAICEGRDVLFDIRQQLSHDTSNSGIIVLPFFFIFNLI